MMLLSAISFASMGVCLKYASESLNNNLVVFFRNVFGLLFLLPWLLSSSNQTLRTKRFHIHLLRSLSGLASMYCFFYSIRYLSLAESMLLVYASPLYVPFIAWLWFKEHLSTLMVACTSFGLAGIALIIKPSADAFNSIALIGCFSGILAAVAMVTIRYMSDTEPSRRIVFYYSVICTIISAIPALWSWQVISLEAWLYIAAAGCFASFGQLSITKGYSLAPAGKVSVFSYSTAVFGGIYGWLLWQQQLDSYSILGMILVILAGVLMALANKGTTTAG